MASCSFVVLTPDLTVREVSAELNVSLDLVRDLIRRKDLPASKYGGCIRVSRADLEAFRLGTKLHTSGPTTQRPVTIPAETSHVS